MTPYDFLIDFAVMSLLLFIAQFLRAHVKLIQKLLIPSSLLAGFLGLILGPQLLNVLPFSDSISSYAYMLVVVLFSSFVYRKRNKGKLQKNHE